MAVLAVWRLIHLLAFIVSKQHAEAHRRDALCSSSKNSKSSCFWYKQDFSLREFPARAKRI